MADFGVDAPYPRDNLFRTSAEYGRICRIASDALSRAIAA
jgi:NitT/TauT family transport system ATP-binding protein